MKNTEERLGALIGGVAPPDGEAAEAARRRQAQLAKPPGSLGRLEELSVRLAGITGKVENTLADKVLLVFAADNGVVCEGVTPIWIRPARCLTARLRTARRTSRGAPP